MKKYTTLLFDADETLLDFPAAEAAAIKTVCDSFGIKYSEEIRCIYSQINLSLWKQLEKGLITRDVIKLRRFEQFAETTKTHASPHAMADCYVEALSKYGILLDGALQLCSVLAKKYDMYIVTNGLTSVQKSRLSKCGLLPYFSRVFISEEFGSQKPEKRFFDQIFEQIPEKNKNNMCIIGDSMSSDILGGINAGIDTCFYNPNGKPLTYTPTYCAESYDELLKIF